MIRRKCLVMDRRRITNILCLILSIGIIALIVLGVLMLQNKQKTESEPIVPPVGQSSGKTELTADEMFICKTELVGLYNKAKELGAEGMLTMADGASGNNVCAFVIRSMTSVGNLGTVKASAAPKNGEFGITLEIDQKKEDQVRLWSKAALFYLNHGIDEKTADEAIETALSEGSAAADLFRIKIRDSVQIEDTKVKAVKLVEITGFLEK